MTIDRRLIPDGARVLCAVSGGADSMCLLHLLKSLPDLQLVAAHYEHGIRGEESLRDAAFVKRWCEENGIPCILEHGNVPAYAKENGLGLEEAARELRYAFLEREAARLSCDVIATAHNADDHAETLLLNLVRGAGPAGLCAIPAVRGKLRRPLLPFTRQEILAYLNENGIPFVEDSSNLSEDYRRNRMRHQVLPLLREMNPRFSEATLRTAKLLRQDEDYLQARAKEFLDSLPNRNSVPTRELLALHPAVSSRVLRLFCAQALPFLHVEKVLAFCGGDGLAYLDLPGLRLRREQGKLFLDAPEELVLPRRTLCPGEALSIPEARLLLACRETVFRGEIHDLFKTYLFKSSSICGTLYCTGRFPGDRYHPQGRGCGKSLHDLFRDAGMTRKERDLCPILRDEKGILAPVGFPADERVKPSIGDPCLEIRVMKERIIGE